MPTGENPSTNQGDGFTVVVMTVTNRSGNANGDDKGTEVPAANDNPYVFCAMGEANDA